MLDGVNALPSRYDPIKRALTRGRRAKLRPFSLQHVCPWYGASSCIPEIEPEAAGLKVVGLRFDFAQTGTMGHVSPQFLTLLADYPHSAATADGGKTPFFYLKK
jgi:hypothetical protein